MALETDTVSHLVFFFEFVTCFLLPELNSSIKAGDAVSERALLDAAVSISLQRSQARAIHHRAAG
jgi:hypothetical protein